MRWISKEPPIYVWKDDQWLNERTKEVYIADIQSHCWRCHEVIVPFTKKTKIMK